MQETIKLSPNQMAHLRAYSDGLETLAVKKQAAEEQIAIMTRGRDVLLSVIIEMGGGDDAVYHLQGDALVRQPKPAPQPVNGLPQPDQTPALQ